MGDRAKDGGPADVRQANRGSLDRRRLCEARALSSPPARATSRGGAAARAGAPAEVAGSPRFTYVAPGASNVAGSTDLHFENGQVFTHTFDVAVCPVSIDTCSLFAACPGFTCVP